MGKREEIRKKRIQKARRQQGILIAIVVGLAVINYSFYYFSIT